MRSNDTERLERAAERAGQRQSRQRELLAQRAVPPLAGDLLSSPTAGDLGLLWLILQFHPDQDSLLYLLPVDSSPLAGSADLDLGPWSSVGPLVVRCGLGFWAHLDELQSFRRAAVLSDEEVMQARQILGSMVRGRLQTTALQRENDLDSDYLAWMRLVEGEVKATQGLMRPASEVISLSAFRKSRESSEPERTHLAASSSHSAIEFERLNIPLECDLPGQLTLIADNPFDMSLLYETEDDQKQPPPQIYVLDKTQGLVLIQWLDKLASVHASTTTLTLTRELVLVVEGQQIKLEF